MVVLILMNLKVTGVDNDTILKTSGGTQDLIFGTGDLEKMRLKGANLGIGTDNPAQPLHIKVDNDNSDPHFFIENANSTGRSHMRFHNSTRNTYWSVGQDTDNSF